MAHYTITRECWACGTKDHIDPQRWYETSCLACRYPWDGTERLVWKSMGVSVFKETGPVDIEEEMANWGRQNEEVVGRRVRRCEVCGKFFSTGIENRWKWHRNLCKREKKEEFRRMAFFDRARMCFEL